MAVMRPDQASTEPHGWETIEELFAALESPLLSYAMRLAGGLGPAEDIVQEVFLAAYRKIHSFDPDRSQFVTWLFTIARNKALTAIRRREKEPAGEGAEPGRR